MNPDMFVVEAVAAARAADEREREARRQGSRAAQPKRKHTRKGHRR